MIILPALIGAILGSGITLLFNLWKLHRDELSSRADEICKAATEAALLALDYWSKKYEANNEQIIAEAKLRAAQDLLDGMLEDFLLVIGINRQAELNASLSEFMDLLTGGTFTEFERDIDLSRARRAPPAASALTVLIRRANRETMPLYRLKLAYHENRRRSLDMPDRQWRCGSPDRE